MTSTRITGVGLIPLNLPMRQPFVTALGQKRMSRNLLVAIRLSSAVVGLGEASASLAFSWETQIAMAKVLRQITGRLIGSPIRSYRRLIQDAWARHPEHPTAIAALECALLDAFARDRGISLWRFCGGRRRSVTTSLTISAWAHPQAGHVAHRAFASGFRRLKVKVTGHDLDEDIRRVAAVHSLAPRATLWVDANQGFTAEEAIRFSLFVRQNRLPVALLEQPVAREDWAGLAKVQREAGIPVVADETASSLNETRRLIRRKIVPAINVKLAKCGFLGALEIIRLAKTAGIRLMIGCMAESSIGLSHSVALACGTGAFDFVDLDSHLLVISPACIPGFATHGPRLSVYPTRPGSATRFPVPR